VRVVVETFTAYHWLPRVAAALAREAPTVDVRVVLEAAREPVMALTRGEIDVAIVSSPVRDRSFVETRLFDDEWVVVMAPEHRLAARRFVSARELADERVFSHDAPRSDIERLRSLIATERAPMPRVATLPLTDVIVECARARLGVGLLSRWAVEPWLARNEIVARRFSRAGLAERWRALTRSDARHLPHVQRFVELVKELAGY
jgi:LysR family transcriptional regulator for metE and metH